MSLLSEQVQRRVGTHGVTIRGNVTSVYPPLDKSLLCVQMSGMPHMHELIFPHDKPVAVIPNTG